MKRAHSCVRVRMQAFSVATLPVSLLPVKNRKTMCLRIPATPRVHFTAIYAFCAGQQKISFDNSEFSSRNMVLREQGWLHSVCFARFPTRPLRCLEYFLVRSSGNCEHESRECFEYTQARAPGETRKAPRMLLKKYETAMT